MSWEREFSDRVTENMAAALPRNWGRCYETLDRRVRCAHPDCRDRKEVVVTPGEMRREIELAREDIERLTEELRVATKGLSEALGLLDRVLLARMCGSGDDLRVLDVEVERFLRAYLFGEEAA